MVQTLFSANIPRKMRNFAPSKRKCAYLRDTRNSFCSLTFCLIKSKETMTKMTSFPDLLTHLRRGKHSDARQNASSFCGNIVTAVRVLPRKDKELQRPTEYTMLQDGVLSRATEYLPRLRKHSDGRQSARCYRMEYSHGRQNAYYNCGNTLTADKVLPQFEQTSRRPTEYSMRKNGVLQQPREYLKRFRFAVFP
jgi:hypothetical protein